jgi:phage terminase large subunit-like protein
VTNGLIEGVHRAQREGWTDWIQSEADEHAVSTGHYFDQRAADYVVEFLENFITLSKGEQKPLELLDWQYSNLFAPLFGWKRPDGRRRYRTSYTEIAKKNGKSTLAAAFGLYMLVADGEMGAEVYSVANDKKQARIAHDEACNMVDASPELSALLDINRTIGSITFPMTKSFYRILSSDDRSNEGWNGSALIIDELHAWLGRKLWDSLRDMTIARKQPITFIITTAGKDPLSVCYEVHEYALGIMRGDFFDDEFLPCVFAADPKDDWKDPATWRKANPSMGSTISEVDFAKSVERVQRTPSDIPGFKQRRLNIWQTSASPWLEMMNWQNCRREYTEDDMAGKPCYAALDLSRTRDTTSIVLVFPWENESVRLLPYFFLPQVTANLETRAPYQEWANRGLIELTDGEVLDYGVVEDRFRKLCQKFAVREITFDPKFAEELTQRLTDGQVVDGRIVVPGTGIPRFAFAQTFANFAAPTAEFERMVICQKLEHNGHPIMDWQIGNAQVLTDCNGNQRPVKASKNDFKKIDGVVCGIMGLARVMRQQAKYRPSVYDVPGRGVKLVRLNRK